MSDENKVALLVTPKNENEKLKLVLTPRSKPKPKPNEVLIAVKSVGIWGSDVH